MCTNGPSDSHANTAVKAHQPAGPRNLAARTANPMTPAATHEIDATFSSKPLGSVDSHAAVVSPHRAWNGLGAIQAAASMPGALLRQSTLGPRHGRPAAGDAIADSTGASATAQTNVAT